MIDKINIKKINTILIANRGAIVSRISFTCQALGIKTLSIFGLQDATSPYIYNTDEAHQINKNGYEAFLDQEEIIKIAKKSGADAIHPGYGFLSENHIFAQRVIDAGLVWIGPSPTTMKLMGDKNTARMCAQQAGVPVVPGAELDVNCDISTALQIANQVGFPLILKDPLGGGGKAAQRVNSQDEFEHALKTTISQAQKLTGTTKILLERYLVNPRHIEIQIAGDGVNYVHLFERDCSIQRRYQKIVEESPCRFVKQETLEKMYSAAIRLSKSVKYQNIGTIEFMLSPQEEFFFLEMNTRLQVEHSITEITTGIDLVAMQVFIAENNTLPLTQGEITRRGHAIECRIYSEDPAQNFLPSVGIIQNLQIPNAPNLRIDHDLEIEKNISPFFDPMQAQVTVCGQTREFAIAYMQQTLKKFQIHGIVTNLDFLSRLLETDEFKLGDFDTQFLTKEIIAKIYKNNALRQFKNDELGAALSAVMQELCKPNQNKNLKNQKRTNNPDNWKNQIWN